ncbi:MAG: hypothetical protein HYW70_03330 [Candidatus Nealsonbacteria bacterium]|nr:hypothetical protein [Candidatus Nealsonbacteria bacterium]
MNIEDLLWIALRGKLGDLLLKELLEGYELARYGAEQLKSRLPQGVLALLDENLKEFRREVLKKRWARASREISLAFLTAWVVFEVEDPERNIMEKEEEADKIAKDILLEAKNIAGVENKVQKEGRILQIVAALIIYRFLWAVQYQSLKAVSSISVFFEEYKLAPIFVRGVKDYLEEQKAA